MEYCFLDAVPWQLSQCLYHSAARLGREALFILRPATPYVCIGYHQDAREEIDLEYTRQHSIPVFRREVGGGAVYLDGDQLFYQLILRRDHPGLPASRADFYATYLQPVVETYREFGVPAEFRPVNDILCRGRKISGNGAGEIEGSVVLVGNFIVDFNYDVMSKTLRVPDEKFRDKVYKTLGENLTTIRRETGKAPAAAELAAALATHYAPLLGPLVQAQLDPELASAAAALAEEMDTPEWLLANDRRHEGFRQVKIAEGVYITQRMAKAPGGLIRATAVREGDRLTGVHLSGDFFFYPAASLLRARACAGGCRGEPGSDHRCRQRFL